jgi:hypothetical protein
MGGEEETARILGSVETVIAHRVNTPDEIVALAGTRKVPELTTRLAEDGLPRERSVHMEQKLTIDPNKVRNLDSGMGVSDQSRQGDEDPGSAGTRPPHTLPVRASQTPSQDAPEPRNPVVDLPF